MVRFKSRYGAILTATNATAIALMRASDAYTEIIDAPEAVTPPAAPAPEKAPRKAATRKK